MDSGKKNSLVQMHQHLKKNNVHDNWMEEVSRNIQNIPIVYMYTLDKFIGTFLPLGGVLKPCSASNTL